MVLSSCDGEDILVSFGGYNGRYNNEVQNILASTFSFFVALFVLFFP